MAITAIDAVYPTVYLAVGVNMEGDKELLGYGCLKMKAGRSHNLNTLFNYPADIRAMTYTNNAIEALSSVIRKAIKNVSYFQQML